MKDVIFLANTFKKQHFFDLLMLLNLIGLIRQKGVTRYRATPFISVVEDNGVEPMTSCMPCRIDYILVDFIFLPSH